MSYLSRLSPRHLAITFMLIPGLLLLVAAYFVFRSETRQPMLSQDHAALETPPILDEHVQQALLRRLAIDVETYAPIVEDNLFSSERQAWSPPLAEDPAPSPQPSAPLPRTSNIRLYGTQVAAQEKIGLFFFGDFAGNNKHRILREGEHVWDGDENGGGQSFQVVRVEPDMAVLLDPAGRSFEIGLYDHRRSASRGGGASVQQGPQIIMSTPARPREPDADAPSSSPDSSEGNDRGQSGDGPAEGHEGMAQDPSSQETDQGAPPPLIPIQNHDEMEQLVEEGKMRKIMTPFGPIYRPIPQQ